MTTEEACRVLGISPRALSRLIEAKALHATKAGPHHTSPLQITTHSIQQLLTQETIGSIEPDVIPRLYTLEEVAQMTGFALRTLQRDARAGRISHIHRGRRRLMTDQHIRELLTTHQVTQQQETKEALDTDSKAIAVQRLRASLISDHKRQTKKR